MKKIISALIMALISLPAISQKYGRNGVVASSDGIASRVGVDILKKGGNAIDAAVATAFALAVTHPGAGNIGGGGFLVYMKSDGFSTTIDFREKAPLAASQDMFLDEEDNLIPNSNHYSAKAIGVPGTVAGMALAHQKYGKLPWSELIQPAINLANNGIPFNWSLFTARQYFELNKERHPQMMTFFSNGDGKAIPFNEKWFQPALAKTLELIRDKGRDGFYEGEVAEKIERFMTANDGIITGEDLSKYEAVERKPLKSPYKEYEMITMPPPSSGGVTLIEMMNMMEMADFDTIPFNSAQYVHFLAEAMRRAYSDRAAYLGDPDFNPELPLNELLSKEHAKKLFESINWNKATKSDSSNFGNLPGGDNTTHYSVIDKDGNAVSVTYTLEYWYGSAMMDKELGFVFNNEMGDFNPKPGITNSKGMIGTAPNLIQPEKRMLSSMTPTIVAKNGKPYLVIGSPGGRTIINTVFQTILNVLEYRMPLHSAIDAMKIHHQWLPDRITFEKDKLSPDTEKILNQMGHETATRENLGRLMGILVDFERKVYIGVADYSAELGEAATY